MITSTPSPHLHPLISISSSPPITPTPHPRPPHPRPFHPHTLIPNPGSHPSSASSSLAAVWCRRTRCLRPYYGRRRIPQGASAGLEHETQRVSHRHTHVPKDTLSGLRSDTLSAKDTLSAVSSPRLGCAWSPRTDPTAQIPPSGSRRADPAGPWPEDPHARVRGLTLRDLIRLDRRAPNMAGAVLERWPRRRRRGLVEGVARSAATSATASAGGA